MACLLQTHEQSAKQYKNYICSRRKVKNAKYYISPNIKKERSLLKLVPENTLSVEQDLTTIFCIKLYMKIFNKIQFNFARLYSFSPNF